MSEYMIAGMRFGDSLSHGLGKGSGRGRPKGSRNGYTMPGAAYMKGYQIVGERAQPNDIPDPKGNKVRYSNGINDFPRKTGGLRTMMRGRNVMSKLSGGVDPRSRVSSMERSATAKGIRNQRYQNQDAAGMYEDPRSSSSAERASAAMTARNQRYQNQDAAGMYENPRGTGTERAERAREIEESQRAEKAREIEESRRMADKLAFKEEQLEPDPPEQSFFDRIVSFGKTVWEGIKNTAMSAIDFGKRVFNSAKNWCQKAWEDVKSWGSTAVKDVSNWIGGAARDIGNAFGSAGQWVGNAAQDVWEGSRVQDPNGHGNYLKNPDGTYTRLQNGINDIPNNVNRNVIQPAAQWVGNNVVRPVSNTAQDVAQWVGNAAQDVWEGSRVQDPNGNGNFLMNPDGTYTRLQNGINDIPNNVNRNVIQPAARAVSNTAQDAAQLVGNAAQDVWEGSRVQDPNGHGNYLKNPDGTYTRLQNGINDIPNNVNRNVIQPAAQWVGNATNDVGQWVGNAAQDVWDGSRSFDENGNLITNPDGTPKRNNDGLNDIPQNFMNNIGNPVGQWVGNAANDFMYGGRIPVSSGAGERRDSNNSGNGESEYLYAPDGSLARYDNGAVHFWENQIQPALAYAGSFGSVPIQASQAANQYNRYAARNTAAYMEPNQMNIGNVYNVARNAGNKSSEYVKKLDNAASDYRSGKIDADDYWHIVQTVQDSAIKDVDKNQRDY